MMIIMILIVYLVVNFCVSCTLGIHSVRVMNDYVIDLCCGTHSVSRALRDIFPDSRIISYDLDPWCATSLIPNHEFRLSDVRDLDPEELKREFGRPLMVWASPPCTQYSIARSYAKTPRDLEGADSVVRACMRIIECLQPVRFAMENPFTGMLKGREVVASWERYLKKTSYCMFGFPYKKETAIWTNAQVNLPACSRLTPCEFSRSTGGRNHPSHAQKGVSGGYTPGQTTTNNLHRVPAGLVALLTSSL
jgi:hypothetical protein